MDKNNDNSKVELFVELLTAHQVRIRKFVLSLVPNFADADDIMQETSRTMWSKFDSFVVGTDFLAWSFKIAHFRVLEFRKNKKRGVFFDSQLLEELSQEASQRPDNQNTILPHLHHCISRLAASDQEILKLKYEGNLKIKDISSRIGKSCHALYKQVAKIHEWLMVCVKHALVSEDIQ